MAGASSAFGELSEPWEVELVGPRLSEGSLGVSFSSVYRRQDVAFLELAVSLGDLAERCEAWRELGTPLLFFGDVIGEAVLQGPDGCVVGRVTLWNEQESLEVLRSE